MKTMESENGRYLSAPDMHTSLGEMMTSPDDSPIASFFVGKSVFITGATGFMGKVLVEKLLRSCGGVKNIYVLLRSKRGVEPRNRLNDLINSKAFDRVREDNPNQLSKVIGIAGDITLPGLGISKADLDTLTQDVSIVFHSAATVKFDEPLRTSIRFNTLGTRYMLEICHKMKKLMALVHVSTAYSNCDRQVVEEKFYPPPAPPKRIIEMTEWMDDETLDALTGKLLGDRPNTYTYTKALAESLLVEEAGTIPVAIVRPSIVTAAWREPYPGWVDNINGPTGLVLASGKGMLRTMLFDADACADLIPVDMVINLMITVAWHTATTRPQSTVVYNCTSGTLNSIKWGDIERVVFPLLLRFPSIQVFRYPGGNFKESRAVNNLCCLYDHILPAYLFDGVMKVTGQKPIMVRLYEKLHRATDALEWFTTHDWRFKSNNVIEMSQQLKGIDQKIFHFDVRNLQWQTYWEDYVRGIRKFILKEPDETLPIARRKLKRVYYTHKFVSILLCFGLWHMLLRAPIIGTAISGAISAVTNIVGHVFGYGVSDHVTRNVTNAVLSTAATTATTTATDSTSLKIVDASTLTISPPHPFNSSSSSSTIISDAITTSSSIASSVSSSIAAAMAALAGLPTTASNT